VLSGEVTLRNAHEHHVLRRHDSCYVHAGEERELRNDSTEEAQVLLVMPYVTARQSGTSWPGADDEALTTQN
jgi:glyoxylate utilization-related uncharacterized protein